MVVTTVPSEVELLRQFSELDGRAHVMEDYFCHVAAALGGKCASTWRISSELSYQNIAAVGRSTALDGIVARYEDILRVLIPDDEAFKDAYAYWTRPVRRPGD